MTLRLLVDGKVIPAHIPEIMKKLFSVAALVILAFSLLGQPAVSVPITQPPGIVVGEEPPKSMISAIATPPAVIKHGATHNSAVHDNFDISSSWLTVIIPLLLALTKTILPKLPPSWLPIIAPILGALGDAIASLVSGNTMNPALGAILGSAGVGLREIIDQIKNPSPIPVKPTAPPIKP